MGGQYSQSRDKIPGYVYLPHKGTTIWWMKYRGLDGQTYRKTTGKTTKREAQGELDKVRGKISIGIQVTPEGGRLTFADGTDLVITDYKINKRKSLDNLERRIKLHLKPYFGDRRMVAITAPMIDTFILKRQEAGASNAEINRELAIIKRAFSLAMKKGLLHQKPSITMLQENNTRSGFFEPEQYEAVRSHLPAPLRPVIDFVYYTGWRVKSEVLPLEWSQVDRQGKTVRLAPGTTKNGQGRVFPYGQHPAFVTLIDGLWTERVALQKKGIICPWVFTRDGARIRDFRGAWKTAAKDAGVPGRIPHDFRRTAVRTLVRAGVPEKMAMQLTGHKTRSVFDRYNIVTEADLGEAVGRAWSGTWSAGGINRDKAGQGGQS